jgi:outer membrane protein assembly factor BamE (lipoprotein component of BamABCDE complex)
MRRIAAALLMLLVTAALLGGCMSAAMHQKSLGSTAERDMTLGVVQKEIRIGMPQADVATALGSPNMVTRDSLGKETWVYDKIATEVSYSRDAGGAGIIGLLIGAGSAVLGGGGASGSYVREAGATSSTQRTLTVVIRFDAKGLVESTSYHASKF